MEFLAAIGSWISEHESMLSGAAAIIVLFGVVVSGLNAPPRSVSHFLLLVFIFALAPRSQEVQVGVCRSHSHSFRPLRAWFIRRCETIRPTTW